MVSTFTLVPKNDFDVFDPSIKAQAINASTAYALTQVPVFNIAGVDYYCFEIEDEYLAWFTILINYRMITETMLKQVIESGIYDPIG